MQLQQFFLLFHLENMFHQETQSTHSFEGGRSRKGEEGRGSIGKSYLQLSWEEFSYSKKTINKFKMRANEVSRQVLACLGTSPDRLFRLKIAFSSLVSHDIRASQKEQWRGGPYYISLVPPLHCSKACASSILVMGSLMGLFLLCNGVFLMLTIK